MSDDLAFREKNPGSHLSKAWRGVGYGEWVSEKHQKGSASSLFGDIPH